MTAGRSHSLDGLRVVEYGDGISAPLAAKLLADLGAEVVKVEPPAGDRSRTLGPFPGDEPNPERSAQHLALNTNKLGVTLDLDTDTGRRLLLELVRDADVFIENAPAGVMERRGLSYGVLSGVNPRLMVASIRPFGLTGPYKGYLGSDLTAWHGSALGHRYLGEPDREPLRASGAYAAHYAGVNAAAAVMLAYHARDVIGQGQLIDISETEVLSVSTLGYGLVALFYETGHHDTRLGAAQRGGAPAAMLPCKDGYVFIFASEAHMWDGLVKAMGEPEWATAEVFRGHYRDRARYAPEIYAMMQPWLSSHGKEEIFLACQEHRVPSTAVYDIGEVFTNFHLRARGFFVQVDQPGLGRVELPGAPYRLSLAPWAVRRPAPRLGEHNKEVLCGRLGLSKAQLAALGCCGVV